MIDKTDYVKKNKIMIYITYAVVLTFVLFNYQVVISFTTYTLSLAMPLYIALAIAFILNIPMKKIETLLSKKITNNGLLRGISLLLTILLSITIIALFSAFIIPKLGESLSLIITNIMSYSSRLLTMANDILSQFNIHYAFNISSLQESISKIDFTSFFSKNGNILGEKGISILSQSIGIFGTFINGIMSFVMAMYILLNKETHIRQVKKIVTYLVGYKKARNLCDIAAEANHYFNGFVSGQLLEAVIIIVIMYIGFRFTAMPFPELIACIIGLVSIVPMFGCYIGFIVGLLLVLAAAPEKAFIFIVTFTVIQQFESNIIYPRVVGNAVGISGIFVLLSLSIFGNLFGFIGLLIAVPLMALIYAVGSRVVNISLYRKGLEVTETSINKIDEETL